MFYTVFIRNQPTNLLFYQLTTILITHFILNLRLVYLQNQSIPEIQLSSIHFINQIKSIDIVGNLGAPLYHGSLNRYSDNVESVLENFEVWEEEEEENLIEISDNPLATGLF